MRTGREVKIYSKVANCFDLKIPKLVNLTNQRREKSEIITSSPQDLEKITKTNQTQIKPKQIKSKLKPKQLV